MTDDEIVVDRLSDAGVPVAKLTWGPPKCVPPLPYATYEERPRSLFADDEIYATMPRDRATLFTASPRDGAVGRFRDAVADLGTYVAHPPAHDGELGAFAHRFDLTLVRRCQR